MSTPVLALELGRTDHGAQLPVTAGERQLPYVGGEFMTTRDEDHGGHGGFRVHLGRSGAGRGDLSELPVQTEQSSAAVGTRDPDVGTERPVGGFARILGVVIHVPAYPSRGPIPR